MDGTSCLGLPGALLALALIPGPAPAMGKQPASRRVMSGYWHNFDNGSVRLALKDVSRDWDLVNVSFTVPVPGSVSKMGFEPYLGTPESFKEEIEILQARGQKVILSIGGAEGHILLKTKEQEDEFVESLQAILARYGFDGIDIDLEASSVELDAAETDFTQPITPSVVHFIGAIRRILQLNPPSFLLTAAPETFYVQAGLAAYGRGGKSGAFLPFLHAFHGRLNYLQVQYYNSGPMRAFDGKAYAQGHADFYVSQVEILLRGFEAGGKQFKPFPPERVLIGLPIKPRNWQSAWRGDFPSNATVQAAFGALLSGKACEGCSYNPLGAYPRLGGLMAWSINWDVKADYSFSRPLRQYLDKL